MTQIDFAVRSLQTSALCFGLEFRDEVGLAQRRRFFGQMRRAMRVHNLALAHSGGLLVVVPATLADPITARHTVVNWLIDQQEPYGIYINPPYTLQDLLLSRFHILEHEDTVLSEREQQDLRLLMHRVVVGALLQLKHRRSQRARA